MARTRNGTARDDLADAEAELIERLVASAAGLPRVCALKRCRRRKRCLGPAVGGELPCIGRHEGLARARFHSALDILGWPNRDGAGNPLPRQSAVGSGQS